MERIITRVLAVIHSRTPNHRYRSSSYTVLLTLPLRTTDTNIHTGHTRRWYNRTNILFVTPDITLHQSHSLRLRRASTSPTRKPHAYTYAVLILRSPPNAPAPSLQRSFGRPCALVRPSVTEVALRADRTALHRPVLCRVRLTCGRTSRHVAARGATSWYGTCTPERKTELLMFSSRYYQPNPWYITFNINASPTPLQLVTISSLHVAATIPQCQAFQHSARTHHHSTSLSGASMAGMLTGLSPEGLLAPEPPTAVV